MLSPLIWVWPPGSIRKVLFPGRLLARAERSGFGFTPVPHSQGFYFEACASFLPHVPSDMSDRLNSTWAAHQTTKSFICAFRRSNLDPIKGTCLLILFTGQSSTGCHHQRALWFKPRDREDSALFFIERHRKRCTTNSIFNMESNFIDPVKQILMLQQQTVSGSETLKKGRIIKYK